MASDLIVTVALLESLTEVMPAGQAYMLLYLRAKCQERGQDWTAVSQTNLSALVGLTRDSVRRALKSLEKTGFIGVKTDGRRTIIHVYRVVQIVKDVKHPPINRPETAQEPPTRPVLVSPKEPIEPPSPAPLKKHKPDTTVEQAIYQHFNELWAKYPKPLGKKEAFRHFRASVKNAEEWADIQRALVNYLAYVKREVSEKQYIQHGSTWFNNWADWVSPAFNPPTPTPMKPKPPEELPKPEDLVSEEDVHALVQKLAGGVKRVP